MFNEIDIALQNSEMVLSTAGKEYEIISDLNPTVLVLHALMNQLKLNTIQYGYGISHNAPILLKEIPADLELIDGTIRFDKKNITVYNVNDIYLYNIFLKSINSIYTLGDVYVSWGKKATIYVDCFAFSKSDNDTNEWHHQFQPNEAELEVLTQRFKILLNHSFLNKLKSYSALWSKKNNADYHLPNWFHTLYQLN